MGTRELSHLTARGTCRAGIARWPSPFPSTGNLVSFHLATLTVVYSTLLAANCWSTKRLTHRSAKMLMEKRNLHSTEFNRFLHWFRWQMN